MFGEIARTVRGERPLGVTYWVWFVLPALAVNIANLLFSYQLDRDPMFPVNNGPAFFTILVVLLVLQVLVTYVIGYGVIQSAMRRKPIGAWGIIAIIVVVLGMIRLPYIYYQELSPLWMAPAVSTVDEALVVQEQTLREARAQLPIEVDEITTLVNYSFDGTTLVYIYDVAAAEDFVLDAELLKTTQLVDLCQTLANLKTPNLIDSLRFQYDINGVIASFDLTDADCDGR